MICLNARNGKEIWNLEIADGRLGFYLSVAPLLVKNRLIIGTSGDQADVPHFVEAVDPENGKVLWWDTVPEFGTAGAATWPENEMAVARRG